MRAKWQIRCAYGVCTLPKEYRLPREWPRSDGWFHSSALDGDTTNTRIGLIVMFRSKNVLDVKSLPDFHRREAPRIIRMVSMRTRVLSTHSTRRIPSCCKFTSLSTYICLIMCSEHTETDFTNPILGKLWLWRILPTALWPSFLRKRGLALSLALWRGRWLMPTFLSLLFCKIRRSLLRAWVLLWQLFTLGFEIMGGCFNPRYGRRRRRESKLAGWVTGNARCRGELATSWHGRYRFPKKVLDLPNPNSLGQAIIEYSEFRIALKKLAPVGPATNVHATVPGYIISGRELFSSVLRHKHNYGGSIMKHIR